MNIYVEFSEDGLFGNADTDTINIPASIEGFRVVLFDRLCKEYPDAGVEVKWGINDTHIVNDIEDTADATENVGEIIHDVWESWEWVEEK